MPDMDGFAICHQLRARSTVPIIVVSARGDEADRVVGLELGADDYLVKPFGFRELVARIRAVSRRTGERDADDVDSDVTSMGALTIDVRTHRVLMNNEELSLTPKEFDLLALLAEEPGILFTRSTILERVWDPHWYEANGTARFRTVARTYQADTGGRVVVIRPSGAVVLDSDPNGSGDENFKNRPEFRAALTRREVNGSRYSVLGDLGSRFSISRYRS